MKMVPYMSMLFFVIFIGITTLDSLAQSENEEEPIKRNNIVLTIGHAILPGIEESGGGNELVYIPTWGLSYEYRFSHNFLLGLKSEVEVSNYVITNNEGTELEREFPISLTLYGDLRILKDWYIYLGPGMEFEKEENLYTISIGTYYEFELPGNWSMVPEVCYTHKGGHTSVYSIALGVCKSF